MYGKHPSQKLREAYKGFQGQEPGSAKFIFIGIDANFSADLDEKSSIFKEIEEYLGNGVAYWREKKRHHPFRSPLYGQGDGYKYHSNFSKMGLSCEYADKISFMELLPCPTYGKTSSKQFTELVDVGYLAEIDSCISSTEKNKEIFIARGVHTKMCELGEKYNCFKWIPESEDFELNKLYTFQTRINARIRIHVITHFSDAISKRHLKDIKNIIIQAR